MRTFSCSVRVLFLTAATAVAVTVFSASCVAATYCVNPAGSNGCYSSIQSAVNHAAAHDVILVGPGTYKEGVVIGMPLSLFGAGAGRTTIDATNQPNGVLIDGYNHHGLRDVVVAGFTVENAQFEGILAVSATSVTIAHNTVSNNDASPGLSFTGAPMGCPGQPAYEMDETGDCGGAIHFIGVSWSTVSGNMVTGNADGLLISDETAMSQGNRVNGNTFLNNPLECGIVLASHPPVGSSAPYFAPHHGVVGNVVSNNDSEGNGVAVGGAGVGLFSDGNGPGRVSENVISHNRLIGNGIGGVNLHTHVGPAFGAPADDMDNNVITGNYIASNLADTFDTETPGRVGININSGGGGSPVTGTIIKTNVITDEDIDIAVNTPATVEIHTNDLLGGKIGVGNICAFDKATIFAPTAVCTGAVYAAQNYWGCSAGPNGDSPCSSVPAEFGTNVIDTPWLSHPVANGHDRY